MTDANDLYYMRARFYSPDLRRFINQDILLGNIADGQSLNRFAYVTGNPISFIDPFGLAPIGEYWENYNNDGQGIIEHSGGRVTQFLGQNTCAIRLSHMFNKSGEPIPLPKDLPRNIRAVSSDKGGNFIYGSRDMGRYLTRKFGTPAIETGVITSENYKEIAKALSGKQGLVQLIAGDPGEYGASGHVDLIGSQGPRTVLKGSRSELEAYFLRNQNAKLQVKLWHLDGDVPDERSYGQQFWDFIAGICGCL